jgi:hypothetical protein
VPLRYVDFIRGFLEKRIKSKCKRRFPPGMTTKG